MLPKPLESIQRRHSQGQRKHHVVRAVRTVQQIPRHFADDSEQQEGKEVSHPVACVGKAFRNQESEHGKGDTTEAPHHFICNRTFVQKVIGAMVCYHRKHGDDFQCASAK